jgi:hypothetical protein
LGGGPFGPHFTAGAFGVLAGVLVVVAPLGAVVSCWLTVASLRTVALCVVLLLEVTATVVFVVVVDVGLGVAVVGATVGVLVVVAAGSTKLTCTGASLGRVSS